MVLKFILFFVYFQVAHSQYYTVPASSYPSYSYNYYSNAIPAATFASTSPNVQTKPPKSLKRNVSSPPNVKCSPQTASAYFLTPPSEKVKATVLPKEKLKTTGLKKEKVTDSSILAPTFSCPLCNNFADIPPNSKLPPPPPIGSPVLLGILEKIPIPTIAIPKDLQKRDSKDSKEKDPGLLSTPPFLDMYEKHKLPKNLSFDQELLEGFLTGLGIAL